MSELRERMIQDMHLRGLYPRTQKNYLRIVREYARYFGKSPQELGEQEVRQYLVYLINSRNLSEGSCRIYFSALKFLYRHTLKQHQVIQDIRYPKRKKKLPVVLALSEVRDMLREVKNLKHKAILTITYSAGLRISETSRLKLTDIDSKRMVVRVQQGKGGKDRYSLLSHSALECLKQYWREYQPKQWLFEGQDKSRHISISSISQIFMDAKKRVDIKKPATPHTLRHSFATHLIETGVSLHHVQLLLGHSSPTTTTVYLHVSRQNLSQVTSPLDIST